jgi:hypothetical protein
MMLLTEVAAKGRLALVALAGAVVFAAATTGSAQASGTHRCEHVRGYYNVKVRGVGCKRASKVLWRARQGETGSISGFHCRMVGHGPGGGFPVKATCRKGHARASGWVVDGPA